VNLAKRKISFKARTDQSPIGNRVLPPNVGTSGDPRLNGATLTVYNSGGLTSDAVVVSLPATGWSGYASGGYRFRGTDPNGPVAKVTVKVDSIAVKGGKANWTYTLDELAQGRVALRLRLGDGPVWCAEAPAKLSGSPPSPARNDLPGKFTGQSNAPPPAACPPMP